MKTCWRYWRRYAIRPLLWLWACGAFVLLLLLAEALLRMNPSGWTLVALVCAWGFYAISDAIRNRPTTFNSIINAETVEVSAHSVYESRKEPKH